jgi:small subunit ribosomal protein S9
MAQKLKKKQTQVKKIVKQVRAAQPKPAANAAATNFTIPNVEYVEAIGRRKVATARVRVYAKPGDFVVNDQLVSDYFANITLAPTIYNKPFEILDLKGKHAVTVKLSGSGISSQIDALVHGLARALVEMNVDHKPLLKAAGLLTRDDRMKETRKIGMGGKARRKRQSPKR